MIKIGIVGRPNVGKSTLFNKLVGAHRAIVTDVSGTTRDILYEKQIIGDCLVMFMDTPGLLPEDELQKMQEIIKEADFLIFLVNGREGVNATDHKIASLIHRSGKKNNTLLVVNKLDGKLFRDFDLIAGEFLKLGFEVTLPLSLKTGAGLSEIKEWIKKTLFSCKKDNEVEAHYKESDYIPLAIVGRPNVGKSTLFNRLIGENIAKVSNEAGTTLDYNVWDIKFNNNRFKLFDLMGIRRKGKISGLEKISLHKLQTLLKYAKPVVVVLIDLLEGVTHRDLTLINEIFDKHRLPVIVAFNKSDDFQGDIKFQIKELGNLASIVPVISISAKTGKNLHKLLNLSASLHQKFYIHIPTSELNKLVRQKYLVSPPTFPKNKAVKIGYLTQIGEAPPTFKVFVNRKEWVTKAFKRWLEKTLREAYEFIGIPIVLEFENK